MGWGYESRCVEQGGAVEPVPEKALERFRSGGLMVKLSMDMLIEALFQAVLSEENKPLSVRHRRVKDRILEAEAAMRQWTKPKLSDPNNERILLQFRERLRQR